MSDNKYIIDKDSLTGIADAVRNKLGTGEATTDETTGEIVYPEDKGYYLKQGKLAGFIYPATSISSYTEIMSVSHETILELCGNINPSFIKFTVLTKGESNSSYSTPSQTLYNGVYFYSGEITNSTTLLNNVVGATKTFAYTGQGCYITGALGSYSAGGWNPNYYSFYSFPGSLRIEFLNENQQNIEAAIDGPIEGRTSGYTMEIPNGEVPTKIPFSIDDIQDRITNYLTSNAVQAFSFNGYYQSSPHQPYVNLSSIFSSRQDLLNRLYNVCVWGLPGTLLIGADGHPVSMRKEGVSLPSNLVSGLGGWDVTDVPTAYDNDQIFRYHFKDPNLSGNAGDTQLAYIYVPSSVTNPFIIFCLDNTIGYSLNSSGNSRIIMYRSA